MKKHAAFSMLELVFVIVIMGIIGKFGVEFLAQSYKSFMFSKINNELEQNSETAVEFIASRLQYRIKDSVIARTAVGAGAVSIGSVLNNGGYTVLEWVSSDIDGFRGDNAPNWSGIIDLNTSTATLLNSPDTNTTAIGTLINTLSYGTMTINDAALYFIGSNTDATSYAWNGVAIANQAGAAIHPITASGNLNEFVPRRGGSGLTNTFAGVDVYEYYKLVWTANAIVYTAGANNKGTLTFYYNYQPWEGQTLNNGTPAVIMENVSTFRFISVGSILKIQVCTKSDLVQGETYSICKEKTVF